MLGDILGFILQFLWELPGILIDLLKNLLLAIFVPSDDYFARNFDNIKNNLTSRLGYQAYIDIFGTLEDIAETGASTIDLNSYQIGTLNINKSKFINFSFITQYKNTWYGWIRGITFIALIFYNINQIYKLVRGTNLIDIQQTMSNMRGDKK